LTTLLTLSRDDDCGMDTATNLEGENFRPLQTAALGTKRQADDDEDGPQVVAHCTSEDFFVTVYEDDEQ
jgi:hypothetical protein